MSESLLITGSVELQLDRLADRLAERITAEVVTRVPAEVVTRVIELLREQPGSAAYGRTGPPELRTPDSDPGTFPIGREHPYSPDDPKELP